MPSNESPQNSNGETPTMVLEPDEILNPQPMLLPQLTETTRSATSRTKQAGSLSRKKPEDLETSVSENVALSRFEAAVGGRSELIETLALAGTEPAQLHFLRLLGDPRRERDGLASLCVQAGIRPAALLKWYKEAHLARAHVLATKKLADSLPGIMEDVVSKSVDQVVTCTQCQGTGLFHAEKCSKCAGQGKLYIESDIDRQKMVFEAAGISGKKPGIQITQQQQTIFSSDGAFGRFVKNSDAPAYAAEDDILDGEVVE